MQQICNCQGGGSGRLEGHSGFSVADPLLTNFDFFIPVQPPEGLPDGKKLFASKGTNSGGNGSKTDCPAQNFTLSNLFIALFDVLHNLSILDPVELDGELSWTPDPTQLQRKPYPGRGQPASFFQQWSH